MLQLRATERDEQGALDRTESDSQKFTSKGKRTCFHQKEKRVALALSWSSVYVSGHQNQDLGVQLFFTARRRRLYSVIRYLRLSM